MQILTVRCKLDGSKTDRAEMAATVEAFARACRSVAHETPDFVTSKYALQAQYYRAIRQRFGLSANLAIRAIARLAANRKAAKATGGSVDNYRDGSVRYDERIFCLQGETASLTLIGGRRLIPLALSDHHSEQLARHAGERRIRAAQLSMKRARGKTTFFLNVQIEVGVRRAGVAGRLDRRRHRPHRYPAHIERSRLLWQSPSAIDIIEFGALSRRKPRKAQGRREDVVARS